MKVGPGAKERNQMSDDLDRSRDMNAATRPLRWIAGRACARALSAAAGERAVGRLQQARRAAVDQRRHVMSSGDGISAGRPSATQRPAPSSLSLRGLDGMEPEEGEPPAPSKLPQPHPQPEPEPEPEPEPVDGTPFVEPEPETVTGAETHAKTEPEPEPEPSEWQTVLPVLLALLALDGRAAAAAAAAWTMVPKLEPEPETKTGAEAEPERELEPPEWQTVLPVLLALLALDGLQALLLAYFGVWLDWVLTLVVLGALSYACRRVGRFWKESAEFRGWFMQNFVSRDHKDARKWRIYWKKRRSRVRQMLRKDLAFGFIRFVIYILLYTCTRWIFAVAVGGFRLVSGPEIVRDAPGARGLLSQLALRYMGGATADLSAAQAAQQQRWWEDWWEAAKTAPQLFKAELGRLLSKAMSKVLDSSILAGGALVYSFAKQLYRFVTSSDRALFRMRLNISLNVRQPFKDERTGQTSYTFHMRTVEECSCTDFLPGSEMNEILETSMDHAIHEQLERDDHKRLGRDEHKDKLRGRFITVQRDTAKQINDQVINRLSSLFGTNYIAWDMGQAIEDKEYIYAITYEAEKDPEPPAKPLVKKWRVLLMERDRFIEMTSNREQDDISMPTPRSEKTIKQLGRVRGAGGGHDGAGDDGEVALKRGISTTDLKVLKWEGCNFKCKHCLQQRARGEEAEERKTPEKGVPRVCSCRSCVCDLKSWGAPQSQGGSEWCDCYGAARIRDLIVLRKLLEELHMITPSAPEDGVDEFRVKKFVYDSWKQRSEAEGGPKDSSPAAEREWAEGRIPIVGTVNIAVPQAHTREDLEETFSGVLTPRRTDRAASDS